MSALIMVWWLFVPTSSAGRTCHPFCFAQSWYWSFLSVAAFSLLGISVASRVKYLSAPHWPHIQTSWKHWYGGAEWRKADALRVNIFSAAWHCSEIASAVTVNCWKALGSQKHILLLFFIQLFILDLDSSHCRNNTAVIKCGLWLSKHLLLKLHGFY